jgi:hypothetical protein
LFYIIPFTIFIPCTYLKLLNNYLSNGFPTDNIPSIQLKYGIVTSKSMIGVENHHKRSALESLINNHELISGVLQRLIALILMLISGICGL